jgi:hypothetical protein
MSNGSAAIGSGGAAGASFSTSRHSPGEKGLLSLGDALRASKDQFEELKKRLGGSGLSVWDIANLLAKKFERDRLENTGKSVQEVGAGSSRSEIQAGSVGLPELEWMARFQKIDQRATQELDQSTAQAI